MTKSSRKSCAAPPAAPAAGAFWASGVHACGGKRGGGRCGARERKRASERALLLRVRHGETTPPAARRPPAPCVLGKQRRVRRNTKKERGGLRLWQWSDSAAAPRTLLPLNRAGARCSSSAVPADMRATRSARCSRQPGAIESATSRSPSLLPRSHASVLLLRTRCRVCRHGNVRGVAAAASWRMHTSRSHTSEYDACAPRAYARITAARPAPTRRCFCGCASARRRPRPPTSFSAAGTGRACGICGWGSPA
jgi:hypothetical protein